MNPCPDEPEVTIFSRPDDFHFHLRSMLDAGLFPHPLILLYRLID